VGVWTALTTAPGEGEAQGLGAALERMRPAPSGVGIFEIEDGSGLWEVGAYFAERPEAVTLELLAAAFGAAGFAVSRLEDRDWVAQVQRELAPVAVGPFFLHGRHDAHRVPVNAVPLRIEAAMAFGTGHHATTVGCLRALLWLHRRGLRAARVADIGTGTGVLAIAAARLWRAEAVATDIDPVAVATARANVAANGAGALVRTGLAAGLAAPLIRNAAPFGLIFANILAAPLKRLAPDIAAHLAPGGAAILSGLLVRQSAGVEAVYAGHGFRRRARIVIGDWATLSLAR
jgi:ribosomal protein L11 methyltransferase